MKRICVYCGASPGRGPDYVTAAKVLGGVLAAKDIGLVYGGASIGVMGALADAITANGGEAIGVIPRDLLKKEIPHSSLASLKVVDSMHERKALMVKLSDGFMALPGGLGTLEELFEVWTWAQLGFHRKPCALLNVRSYFDPLIKFLDSAVEEGFITENHRSMLMVGNDPAELILLLESYRAPEVPKWLRQDSL
jgi:uncharacterized protein (TIGR00730 family)